MHKATVCLLPIAGERNSIGIGVCNKTYPIDIMPGVKEGSIAICTEEAAILHFPQEPQPLGFNCRRGCVIKCAVVPDPMDDTKVVVEFYKDRDRVRAVSIHLPEGGLYGLIGLMSQGERILISPPVVFRRLEFSQVWDVCTPHMIQHHRGGLCSYVGPGYLNDESIGTVRTKKKMDPLGPLSARSFEIRIVNPGEKMYIAIGICNQSYPHNMLPGWKETSVGYHADNGFLFYNSDSGQPTNHPCKEGDIIRCTVQPMDGSQKQVSVLFHRNGHLVEKLTAWTPDDGFYGSFGMMSKRECVHVSLPEISEPYTIPKASFLSVWEAVTTNLQYNDNGIFEYTGAGGPDSIGTVRSKAPLNPLSTFEVKIINPGDSCYIALGVCNPNYPATQLPGWTENSVGFHADNGLILNGIGDEQIETRCTCVVGDVIRCTLEPVDGSNKQLHVIFHRNNVVVGKILIWNSRQGFYAQVGSMSKGEVIQIASPQTVPSSLTHDAHPRSMSVPVSQITKDAIKRKQLSTSDYSRMTPAVRVESNKEPSSEQHSIPHAHTMPVFPTTSHYAEYPHGTESTQETSPQHATAQLQHAPSDTFPHHQHVHPSFSLTPSGRNIPQHHLVPFEQAPTASPFPLQPATGHPLANNGNESVTHHSQISLHDARHNPFYASQVSVASAASDSDQHYRSQENLGDVKSHAASVSHVHSTHPTETSKRYRTQTEPITQTTPLRGAFPPLVTKFEPDLSHKPATPPTDGLKVRVTQNRIHQTQSVKHGFEYTDSLVAINNKPLSNAKEEIVLESVQEPVKEIEVGSSAQAPPLFTKKENSLCRILHNAPPLFTKKENSLCRILHNVMCSEDGTLQCTLPVDSHETSFVMRRLQLTEKMPYFEVELIECKTDQNIIIGLVPQDHPHTSHIGVLPHTIAYHTATGSLVVSDQDHRAISKPCIVGDVVGCRIEWSYKLEVCDPTKESFVNVEWYRNGCSIAERMVSITSSGFFPALEMTSGGTVVAIRHSINLKPESYFASHPLPENYNIDIPSHTTKKWNCIQNAQIDENDFVMFKDQDKISSQSTIVQSQTPFTTVNSYFEIELQYPIGSYAILSVGGLERISSSKPVIPGEAPNSIALFPLLGFVMRNGSISMTLPQSIEAEIKNSSEKLKVGVGVDFHQNIPQYSASSTRVTIFFTINCQLINSTYITFPTTGLFPTVAIGSDFRKVGEKLLQLQFSHPRPQQSNLPLGFARAPQNAFLRMKSRTIAAENVLPEGKDTPQALQAALPLSQAHSYYEVKIVRCHESHVFSCGVAPNTFSLTSHPGDSKDSFGFHPSEGSIHHNGAVTVVCPPCNYKEARIGCGARFPNEGSSKYMEVFFTLDGSMIAQGLVATCEPGLFPTIGFYTKGNGAVSIDLYAEDPYPDLQYKTTWRELSNITAEGPILQTTSSSDASIAQLVQSVLLNKPVYFTIRPLIAMDCRVAIGFANCTTCPLFESKGTDDADIKESLPQGWDGCILDMATGEALVESKLYSIEQCNLDKTQQYGCGIEPIQNSSYHLFFFTRNDQVVFCRRFHLTTDSLFPTIFASGNNTRLYIDTCAMWPLQTPIGKGWGRINHLVLENAKIRHTATDQRAKIPVGFAQASMPIIPSSSYFEVEVCSRSADKAIAVGLASRTYPSNTWVGWKSNSVAYHLDDGNLFTGSGMFSHKIGPKIYQGHTVGCGVNIKSSDSETGEGTKVEVFFTVNGAVIVEQKIAVPSGGFYPTICLESPTESVIFHRYPHFSSVCDLMGSEWGNCYSVQKVGMVVEHSCKHKEYMSSKGFPRGFCQASQPFSPSSSYFEVSIVENANSSMIQAGIAVEIPVGYRSINIDSVMFSGNGQAQLRSGGNKSTSRTEKFGIGDVVGCRLVYTNGHPTSVEFYLNKMKLTSIPLFDRWKEGPLFPTIVLLQPGNAVIPQLNLSPPQWDPSCLIGWLRTERVHVRGNIAGYHSLNDVKNEIGLCQVSQCLDRNLNSSFEVEILDRGKDGLIAVGVASTNYPAVHQPGWKENSVAYHGDDGNLFNNNPYGVSFGPSWKERDIIGVGVRPPAFECPEEHETQVYFTRNGLELGHTTIAIPPSGLFPTIGFHSPGERVKIMLNPSPNGLGNFNTQLLRWKDMCGIQLHSTSQENQCILQYHDNGRKMPFTGVRLAVAIYGEPFSEKLQYIELDILSMESCSAIAIGAVPKRYSLDYAPGWGKESLGYHTDNGQLYQGRDRGKYFGPIAKKGDSIGCGINFIPNNQRKCSIYFTYNGVEIGRVRTAIPQTGLYPCLCLTQKYDKVRVTISETFKPRVLIPELHMVGLMRISNCSYSDQIVQYSGGNTHSSLGIAQFAVPMHKDRNYFAAHILKADDTILIGLAVRDYPLKYPPGSMSISMAYDVTKGSIKAVYDSENFHNFIDPGLICIVGDRVGCGVVSSDSKSEQGFVYFTRNKVIVKKIQLADLFEDLYPVVGFVAEKKSSLLFMDWNMPLFNSPNLLHDF